VLMQNGCTAGLWATHAAQQECHCHRIQAIIHGHHQVNRYTAGKSAHVCSNCQATQGAHQFTSTATPRDGMHTNGPVILGQISGGPTNPQAMSSVPAGAPTAVQVAPLDTSRLGPPPGIATEHGQNPVIAAPALPAVVAPPATPAEPVPFVAPTPEFPADLPSLPSLPPPPAGGGTMPAPMLPALPAFEDPMPAPAQPGTAGPTSPLPDAPMQSSDSLVAMRAKKNLR